MEFSRCSQSANGIYVHQETGFKLMICGLVYCLNVIYVTKVSFEADGGAAILKSTVRSKCMLTHLPLSVHVCVCDIT